MRHRVALLGLGLALMMGPLVVAPVPLHATDTPLGLPPTPLMASRAFDPYCPYPIAQLANGDDCKGEYGGTELR